MKNKIWLAMIAFIGVAVAFGVARVQAQREAAAEPAITTVEYRVVPVTEIGIDPNDILARVDYDMSTRSLNRYAADGWRVHSVGMLGRPAVLLERDVAAP